MKLSATVNNPRRMKFQGNFLLIPSQQAKVSMVTMTTAKTTQTKYEFLNVHCLTPSLYTNNEIKPRETRSWHMRIANTFLQTAKCNPYSFLSINQKV
jgi:hypothetical protein